MKNVIKLTRNECKVLYFICDDIIDSVNLTSEQVKEFDKICGVNPFEYNVEPLIILDYIGDILKQECEVMIEFFNDEGDKESQLPYKNILKKINSSTYNQITNRVEQRFKVLALLCLNLGVLDDKMKELADKIDECHPQVSDAMDMYEKKIIELYSVNN
jgi:hypothetical protein